MRRVAWVVLCGALLAAPRPVRAQDPIVIHTQNLLRFGHGSRTPRKCLALDTASFAVDVIVIQELMKDTIPCTGIAAGFTKYVSTARGTTSYKEYYGFLVRTTPRTNGRTIALQGTHKTASGNFMRPPEAILLNVTRQNGNVVPIWVVNIHSIWGKGGVDPRRAEARLAATFFSQLRYGAVFGVTTPVGGFPVIIAGDWNLQYEDASSNVDPGWDKLVAASANIDPSFVTSLTKGGLGSSPYDHFAYFKTPLTVANVRQYPASTWLKWRTEVSDHLGVRADVAF